MWIILFMCQFAFMHRIILISWVLMDIDYYWAYVHGEWIYGFIYLLKWKQKRNIFIILWCRTSWGLVCVWDDLGTLLRSEGIWIYGGQNRTVTV